MFYDLEAGIYTAITSAPGYGEGKTEFAVEAGVGGYATIYLEKKEGPVTVRPIPPISGGGGGGQLANKVVIKAYVDFQDPFSARFYTQTWPQIQEKYGDKVVLDLRDFPLSFHPDAEKAAEAFRCERGNLAYAKILFSNQQALDIASLKKYALKVEAVEGLDTATSFELCLDSGEMKEKVSSYINEGNQNGITGTPTFFIGSKTIIGAQPYENFREAIETALSG